MRIKFILYILKLATIVLSQYCTNDSSCKSCSTEQISTCSSCAFSYIYDRNKYQCLKTCQDGTYINQITMTCENCYSAYCKQCSDTTCTKCNDGYTRDPNNAKNCIAICNSGQILNDENKCGYGCGNDLIYDADYTSNTCVVKQECPFFTNTPTNQNTAVIVSTLLDYTQNLFVSIDQAGTIVLYSYPKLVSQLNFAILSTSQKVSQCRFVNQNDFEKGQITCLLNPLSILKFTLQTGAIISNTVINTRTINYIFESTSQWILISAYQDLNEIWLIDLDKMKFYQYDSFSSIYFLAKRVKKIDLTIYTEIMSLDMINGTMYYYPSSTIKKLVYSTTASKTLQFIQLNNLDYWIIYNKLNLQLLKFNDFTQMSLVQSLNLLDNINSIFSTAVTNEIIINTSSKNTLSLYLLNTSTGILNIKPSSFVDNNIPLIYINQTDSFFILCMDKNVELAQITNINNSQQFQFLNKLKQINPNLCSASKFTVFKIGSSYHVWQVSQKNIYVDIVDTLTNSKQSSLTLSFAQTTDVQNLFSTNAQLYEQFVEENQQTQEIHDFKTLGLVSIMDPTNKRITNMVRFWYPKNDDPYYNFFNQVRISGDLFLFVGYEITTLKIKFINVKTFEITYEQEFPEVQLNIDEFRAVQYPTYFPKSDSILIPMRQIKQSTDTQKRYQFHVIKKSSNINSQLRYQYYQVLNIQGFAILTSISAEVFIMFDLQGTQMYKMYIYDLNFVRQYTSTAAYKYKDGNCFGQVDENNSILYFFGYQQIWKMDLLKFSISTLKDFSASTNNQILPTCISTTVISPDFKLTFIQSVQCGSLGGIYTFPAYVLIFQSTIVNQYLYVYDWADPRWLSFKTGTTGLLYDVQKNILYNFAINFGQNQAASLAITGDQIQFYNAYAVVTYDLNTNATPISITQRFRIIPKALRYLYIIQFSLNLVQVKQYTEIMLAKFPSTPSIDLNSYFVSYVPEINFVVILQPTKIEIWDSFTNQIKQAILFTFPTRNTRINFNGSETFTRQTLYYQPSNTLIIIYFRAIVFINVSNLNIISSKTFDTEYETFKNIAIDWDLGYIVSMHNSQDCIYNMKDSSWSCGKDKQSYIGTSPQSLGDYMQQAFINPVTKIAILCQASSIRLFDLKTLKYINSYYDTTFLGAFYYYNSIYNYLIYSTQKTQVFGLFDLNTMLKKEPLGIFPPSGSYQTDNYRFYFMKDGSYYIHLTANYQILFVDQQTHVILSTIVLENLFFYSSTWVIDEDNKYIFLIDVNHIVNHISFSTNKILKYQLSTNPTDITALQKQIVWDKYRQRLMVISYKTFYVINILKNIIELIQPDDDFLIQIQLVLYKNILSISSYSRIFLFDYDYLVGNSNSFFPNQIHPRFFMVNDNSYFHFNDINSQVNYFENNQMKFNLARNNYQLGYFRILENNLSSKLVYTIFDKEIQIVDLSQDQIIIVDKIFYNNFIQMILHENNNEIYLYSSSQELLTLQKRSSTCTLTLVSKFLNGIQQYIFRDDLKRILFTDTASSSIINIMQLNNSGTSMRGSILSTINIGEIIVDFKYLDRDNNKIIILLQQTLVLYDIDMKKSINLVTLPNVHKFSNIQIDNTYNRIYIQNKLTGTLVFTFDLFPHPLVPQINTFSSDLSLDSHFIYSITSHSANIYFRKDMKFLINFRNFSTDLQLNKISYLGVGYIFLVEFLTKMSIYELSQFISEPQEIMFVSVSQFTIIKSTLSKMNTNINNYLYSCSIVGLRQEGMFTYSISFDIYNNKQSNLCSWTYPLLTSVIQETNTFNQLNSYLSSSKRILSRLTISIDYESEIRLPLLQKSLLGANFDLTMMGTHDLQKVYILKPLDTANYIYSLKFNNLNINQSPSFYLPNNNYANPVTIEINKTRYPILQKFTLEEIKLIETSIKVSDIDLVIIKRLIPSSNSVFNKQNSTLTNLKISGVTSVIITEILIDSEILMVNQPLIEILNTVNLQIDNIIISNCQFQGITPLFNFINSTSLSIGTITLTNNQFSNCSLFQISSIKTIKINYFSTIQFQLKSVINNTLRQLLTTSDTDSETETETNKAVLLHLIQTDSFVISKLKVKDFQMNSTNEIALFSLNYVNKLLQIDNSDFSQIQQEQNPLSYIFSLSGIRSTLMNSINAQQIINIGFINLQPFQSTDLVSVFNSKFQLNKVHIIQYRVNVGRIFNIQAVSVVLDDFNFEDINSIQSQQIVDSTILISSKLSITIKNSLFSQINNFELSMIHILDTQNIQILNTKFEKIQTTGSGSSLSLTSSQSISLDSNTFSDNASEHDGGSIVLKDCNSISLLNNIFLRNKSLKSSGGAFYCSNSKFKQMNHNYFIQNTALNGSGGAFLLVGCDIQDFSKNEFRFNSAFIGGGLRYQILKPLVFITKSILAIKQNNIFFKNSCKSYGQDISSYPIILDVKNTFDDDKYGIASLKDVQSGYSDKPLLIRFIDEEMKEISFFDSDLYLLLNTDIKQEFDQYYLSADSKEIGLQGDLKQIYSLRDSAFVFNLTYQYNPGQTGQLEIKSTQVLPQFPLNQQAVVYSQFKIDVRISFRMCQIGEIIQKIGQYSLCYACEKGFYSLEDPNINKDIICKKCPNGSIDCEGSNIEVKNGYWRSNNMSDVIVSCSSNPNNCIPEDGENKNGCIEGHIGPLCESCDLRGEIWGKMYGTTNDFLCNDCTQFSALANIFIFVLIFLLILGHTFMQVYKQISVSQKQIMMEYLIKLQIVSLNFKSNFTQFTSELKILLNYFQFMMILNSLEIPMPVFFSPFNIFGGDTSQQTINRIDCFLFYISSDLPNYILRIIWVNSHPIIFFTCIEILSSFVPIMNSQKKNNQTTYTNLIIMFVFFQPTIIKVLSQSISCRSIGNKQYVISDLNSLCFEKEHLEYIYFIILPLLALWLIIGPLFFLQRLTKYKSQMDKISIIYKYGYLFQEYRREIYYWDIVRLYMRSVTIILINLVRFNIILKSLIIYGLMASYIVLQQRKKPYQQTRLNNLDKESSDIVLRSLYLLFIGYYADNLIINYFSVVLLFSINFWFIVKVLKTMFLKPISSDINKRNFFQNILYHFKSRYPSFFTWVKILSNNSSRVRQNWKKVKLIQLLIKKNADKIKEIQIKNIFEELKQSEVKNHVKQSKFIDTSLVKQTDHQYIFQTTRMEESALEVQNSQQSQLLTFQDQHLKNKKQQKYSYNKNQIQIKLS